ncbi:MAG: ABC transporter permease [Bauldia sp.]|nr:ABC transporter permease [Bauldia sp.]
MKILRDTWLIFTRSLSIALRNPIWVLIGLMQPILYLALFGPLLAPLTQLQGFPPGDWTNVFVPGLLLQITIFSAFFAGFGLLAELRSGVLERMRVTPMNRMAMFLGRALRDVVLLFTQSLVLVLLALPFGLRVGLFPLVASMILLGLVGLTMASLSYAAALWLKSEDAMAPFLNMVAVPMLLLSGLLLPMSLGPDWLKWISLVSPLTHAVDAMRSLFAGQFDALTVFRGFAVTGVFLAFSLWVATGAFSRSQA